MNKWEELKGFLENELNGIKNDKRTFKPDWEENYDSGCGFTLIMVLRKMKALEKEVQEKGGF